MADVSHTPDETVDVLVIGGGLSGAWAAFAAARAGATVILADKGYCGTSGVTATAGPGHWWVPPDPNLRAAAIDRKVTAGLGLADPDWMARILDLTWTTLPTLAPYYRFSVDEAGRSQYRALRGPEYLRALRQQALAAGVHIRDHYPALELLRDLDGAIAGAAGIVRRTGERWSIRAGATILATGGAGFRAHLLGGATNTGDGHLMAAEAGNTFSGMEFSTAHCIAPQGTTMTRSMSYAFAQFFDEDDRPLAIPPGPDNNREIASALLKGRVFVRLDRTPQDIRDQMPRIQPNFGLTFARSGIDPYADRFEITLRAEGTIRGTGGLRLRDAACAAEVAGLFAIGDLASREPVAGAVSGGGAVNSSWALSSGVIAGRAAADRALALRGRTRGPLEAIGQAGLRPRVEAVSRDPKAIERQAQDEILPFDKIYFRDETKLRRSVQVLDALWREVADHLGGAGTDALRTREAAAITATIRWATYAGLHRRETRGMHYRTDFPAADARQAHRLNVSGLDHVTVAYEGTDMSLLGVAS